MHEKRKYLDTGVLFLMAMFVASVSSALPQLPPAHSEEFRLYSGLHDGLEVGELLAFQGVIEIPGATWLRVIIAESNLGKKSYITLTSVEDGSRQYHDAGTLSQWRNMSAFFNGDSVVVKLYVAPGERGIFFRVDKVVVGEEDDRELGLKSICGDTDDRVASTDSRVGRLFKGGCTAFLVSNGAVLTAGHCTDFDPDQDGPLLPDGVLDLWGVVEFNVPDSDPDGDSNWANADDQYAIDTGNVTWNFDGSGQGLGKDWSVFAVFPNTNNQDRAHVTRGFFRMTREKPSVDSTIRVTGYGVDDDPPGSMGGRNAQNFTEQTHTGDYKGEESSGDDIWHKYRVDTMGANSGSPITWNSENVTIGIHTNAGCSSTGGSNKGTSFEHNPLENTLQDFPGPNTSYVDKGMPNLATGDGTVFRPFDTVVEGVGDVAVNGTLSIVAGSYDETMTISKTMTIVAPVGSAIIGQ